MLQCFALKETIRQMGYDVQVIDYRQPQIENSYRYHYIFDKKESNGFGALLYLLRQQLANIYHFYLYIRKRYYYTTFQKSYLSLSCRCNRSSIPTYDCYVIGSDMLWDSRCLNGQYDDVYFGDFNRNSTSTIVGYAISGSQVSLSKCVDNQGRLPFINNFNALSIREEILTSFVKKFTNKDIITCIDPTLLADKSIWDQLIKDHWMNKNYIVTYYIRIDKAHQLKINERLKKIAKNEGCEIINIDAHHPMSINNFVSILKYSRYLVTDSFHGIVFSLIFQRNFSAIKLNDSHDDRYVDLLKKLELEELIVDLDFTPSIPYIDYTRVETLLSVLKQNSFEYLEKNLG